jgi:hypothetical protein
VEACKCCSFGIRFCDVSNALMLQMEHCRRNTLALDLSLCSIFLLKTLEFLESELVCKC